MTRIVREIAAVGLCLIGLVACTGDADPRGSATAIATTTAHPPPSPPPADLPPIDQRLLPLPLRVAADTDTSYLLTASTQIVLPTNDDEMARLGDVLAEAIHRWTGRRVSVGVDGPASGTISLALVEPSEHGAEGYVIEVTRENVRLQAGEPAGLFRAVQTLQQILPSAAETGWIPGGRIVDRPRFEWRGAMLDVARHFFDVEDVKEYIDLIALYRMNVLHLHLTDDQGWRIAIDSWPRLATHGGGSEVGGGPGGFYTQREYRDLVAYAASRHMTVIPEIDMPGHTNAALSSYAELNCNDIAPPLYTGIEVGFSSLCVNKEITYRFIDDVLRELSAMTPGQYIHIGTDEAHATTPEDYLTFINRVLPIVAKHGKKVTGWHQFVKAIPPTSAIPQFWGTRPVEEDVRAAAARGNKILMSPANKAYLDMKYNRDTPLGLSWAGFIEVDTAYGWDPSTAVQGVPESSVVGLEAPLWSETLEISDHIEFMAFPRLPAYAEIGWSPLSTHNWESFRQRLALQGPRWTLQGIDFFRSAQIPWPA